MPTKGYKDIFLINRSKYLAHKYRDNDKFCWLMISHSSNIYLNLKLAFQVSVSVKFGIVFFQHFWRFKHGLDIRNSMPKAKYSKVILLLKQHFKISYIANHRQAITSYLKMLSLRILSQGEM